METLSAQAKLLASLSTQLTMLIKEHMERTLLDQHHQIPYRDVVPDPEPQLQPLVINGISYYPRPQ
jgi:hypothetical protein